MGGSPANIAVGVTHHGMKAGFFGKVSDDQFGDFVVEYFDEQGIDTSRITRCKNGEKLGLTFTEMLSPKESSILMYRNRIADLQLHVDDIDEEYIKNTKAILISGTALAESPSRESVIKAVMLAKKNDTKIILTLIIESTTGRTAMRFSVFGIKHTGENYGYVMLGIVIATFAAPGVTVRVLNSYGKRIKKQV